MFLEEPVNNYANVQCGYLTRIADNKKWESKNNVNRKLKYKNDNCGCNGSAADRIGFFLYKK